MRLDELDGYVATVQRCAADLRGLLEQLDGTISARAHVPPAPPASTSSPATSTSSSSSSAPAPSFGFHAPAAADAPRLQSGAGVDAAARAYALRLVKLHARLVALHAAFSTCTRVALELVHRFAGERCDECSNTWAVCKSVELELELGAKCCSSCSHGRAPRTLSAPGPAARRS